MEHPDNFCRASRIRTCEHLSPKQVHIATCGITRKFLFSLVADEGFEPPLPFWGSPAYETGKITNFFNPQYLSAGRDSNPHVPKESDLQSDEPASCSTYRFEAVPRSVIIPTYCFITIPRRLICVSNALTMRGYYIDFNYCENRRIRTSNAVKPQGYNLLDNQLSNVPN